MDVKDKIQIVAQISQIITGLGTLFILCITIIITLRSKRTDILLEVDKRFNESQRYRRKINGSQNKEEATSYYYDFWNVQHNQYDCWKQGYIDDATFKYWMTLRKHDYDAKKSIAGMEFKEGWEVVAEEYKDTDFAPFINKVFESGVDEAFESEGGKSFRSRFTKFLIGK
jgi:hypothetical protein